MEDFDSRIEILLDHPYHQVDEAALITLLSDVARLENRRIDYLSVVLTDHATVLELNRQYLDHDYLTDVLSFSLGEEAEPAPIDGEVYVDLDTAAERHSEFGVTFEEEVRRYTVHGLLHLIGYDDSTPDGASEMRGLEDRYLRGGEPGQQL